MGYTNHTPADPPRSLAEHVGRLTSSLDGLGEQVKDAVARAVGSAVADAVRDTVGAVLGCAARVTALDRRSGPFRPDPLHPDPYREDDLWGNRPDDSWREPDSGWAGEEEEPPHRSPDSPGRLQAALEAALQAGLWWLRHPPCRRPVLTAALVAVVAGGTALVAGPVVTTIATTLASAVGLVTTADSARRAAACLAGLLTRRGTDPAPDNNP